MRCYLIRDYQVTVLAQPPAPVESDALLIQSIKSLDPKRFPLTRLIAIWNSLPGVEPVSRFRDRASAVKRVWTAFEALPISSARTDSKQAQLLALLHRPSGASLSDLMAATGWQAHSVRGVLSGVIKKKLGLPLDSAKVDGTRIYRIAA